MKKLTAERASELKENGITYIASIVKSLYRTEYYKIETIDTILQNGGKMPEYPYMNGYVRGTNGKEIDWNKTIRWSAI